MNRVADFELIEQLQPGNHGTFYVARAPARLGLDEELVALKVLDRHASNNEFKRMAAELEVLLEVNHRHLVDVIDAGHDQGRLYYATRYFQDGSVEPGPTDDIAGVATQIADAAEAAHALHEIGVAHRDIKPSNILLQAGRGHLSDLGVANYTDAQFTATGSSPVGTLAYTDPRLIHGDPPGRSSDIWSLGAALHLAVTGESVIGEIPNAHLAAAIEYVLGAEARLAPGCPTTVGAVVARATQPERVDRYHTALELAADLRALAGDRLFVEIPGPGTDTDEGRRPFPIDDGRQASAALAPYQQPVFVIGHRSSAGYFNRPDAPFCRVSGEQRDALGPWRVERGPRPPLGVLLVDGGPSHLVQWDLLLGRQPEFDDRVAQGLAAPVAFPSEVTMSRAHLYLELRQWDVVVTDLSTNGTKIRSSGYDDLRPLPPGEAVILADGDVLMLESRSVNFRRYR